ncbi:glycine cleavage system protein T [Longibacter salinarum]|uniref:Aminomethyltransferase n=1 Tax=Longibacter salinarum TaxID=1850348 RepID=A0A2A8D1U0_9BACT|nr:glycine cleavage system aminomethyltransferase GcvT [Longibacter salinarum]PEN14932.1 glycine cleavage system protein T [Longibacter salinarum]
MAEPDTLQYTPLHDAHLELDARMMAFGGFDMPVQYSSIIEEHRAVREAAGLFDVSHMGEVEVSGPKAFDFVQHLVTNDAGKLYDGRAMYTVMCKEDGGIVDDLLVYRRSEESYLLVINASNIEKDISWMRANNPMDADLINLSNDLALLALQGPKSFEIAQPFVDASLDDLKFYHFREAHDGAFMGLDTAIVSRTGYTGEIGLELYVPAADAVTVWNQLLETGEEHGLIPTGLGARDTLRLEAGYCLYGNDITEETNPYEAGLGWVVKLDAGPFVGREALEAIKTEGPARTLVGFVATERGIPRSGYPIETADGNEIGVVTSGSQSPMLETGIGLGYVPNDAAYSEPGTALRIGGRRPFGIEVRKPPLHKSE